MSPMNLSYRVDLPRPWRSFCDFHARNLTLSPPNEFEVRQTTEPDFNDQGEAEYIVSDLGGYRTHYGKPQYYVMYQGYSVDEGEWRHRQDLLTTCPELVRKADLKYHYKGDHDMTTDANQASTSPPEPTMDDPVYEVTKLTEYRTHYNRPQYYVLYKGYADDEGMWQDRSELLETCPRLVHAADTKRANPPPPPKRPVGRPRKESPSPLKRGRGRPRKHLAALIYDNIMNRGPVWADIAHLASMDDA